MGCRPLECRMPRVTLTCHPATPAVAVRGIHVDADLARDGRLTLIFAVRGLDRLVVPAPRPESSRADRLWQHTCFEAFIGRDDGRYSELNLSPSGEWNLYDFDNYRSGMRQAPLEHAPDIRFDREERATLTASVVLDVPWCDLGLAAVIEEEGRRLSYWALAHRGAKPDFHDRSTFTLRLGARA
jgi:hypothetical protein